MTTPFLILALIGTEPTLLNRYLDALKLLVNELEQWVNKLEERVLHVEASSDKMKSKLADILRVLRSI